MGRIMAIDWGERRIGVALSDESRTIASPHTVIQRGGSLDHFGSCRKPIHQD